MFPAPISPICIARSAYPARLSAARGAREAPGGGTPGERRGGAADAGGQAGARRAIMCAMPRRFHGSAAQVVAATLDESFALLAAVDRYPQWCPDVVREVEVLGRGAEDRPSRVRMRLHVTRGPLERDFDLLLAVVLDVPRSVKLTRFTDHPTNQEFDGIWLLQAAAGTRISLELDAVLRVPSYIPAGGVGDTIAEAFVTAAARALGGPAG